MSGTVGVKMLYLKANQALGITLICHLYIYIVAPVNIARAISQEDKQESEEKIVQRLQGTTLVVARLPCAHCLAVLSAHFIVVCLARFWYVPKLC